MNLPLSIAPKSHVRTKQNIADLRLCSGMGLLKLRWCTSPILGTWLSDSELQRCASVRTPPWHKHGMSPGKVEVSILHRPYYS